jgi:hypothetical protein
MDNKFDIDAALAGLKSGQDLMGKDGVLTALSEELQSVTNFPTSSYSRQHKYHATQSAQQHVFAYRPVCFLDVFRD